VLNTPSSSPAIPKISNSSNTIKCTLTSFRFHAVSVSKYECEMAANECVSSPTQHITGPLSDESFQATDRATDNQKITK